MSPNLIPLSASAIHLWLAFYDEIDVRLHGAYRALLNTEEREQEPRFYFARDRRRYLVTRALVRTVLSRYASVDPRDWQFAANAYGRPYVVNAEGRGVSFNISHTQSLIVLGVTAKRALGVDVENIRAREVSLGVAGRYFAAQEVAVLNSVHPEHQQYRFFEYWTFKESYIKARGMGLSLPLDKFSFQYPCDRSVSIAIDSELGDDAARWQFWQFRPTPEYLVAVCSERNGGRSEVDVRKTVPLVMEQPLAHEFLRVSEHAQLEN